jgi:aldehyde:ferredoxin oxidoreductase
MLGKKTLPYAVHVKGLELIGYHPSAIMGTALGYAVSSRGGDYNNVYASLEYSWSRDQARKEFGTWEAVNIKSPRAKGKVIAKAVVTNILVDSLGLCKVPVLSLLKSFNLEKEVCLIRELTGLDLTRDGLFQTGRQIASLERRFNHFHALQSMEDTLPDMFIARPGKGGLTMNNFKTMLGEYYRAMGWDKNGIPPDPVW